MEKSKLCRPEAKILYFCVSHKLLELYSSIVCLWFSVRIWEGGWQQYGEIKQRFWIPSLRMTIEYVIFRRTILDPKKENGGNRSGKDIRNSGMTSYISQEDFSDVELNKSQLNMRQSFRQMGVMLQTRSGTSSNPTSNIYQPSEIYFMKLLHAQLFSSCRQRWLKSRGLSDPIVAYE